MHLFDAVSDGLGMSIAFTICPIIDMELRGKRGKGRLLNTFEACLKGGIKRCNLKDYDPLNRDSQRSAVWYSNQAVSPPVGELG